MFYSPADITEKVVVGFWEKGDLFLQLFPTLRGHMSVNISEYHRSSASCTHIHSDVQQSFTNEIKRTSVVPLSSRLVQSRKSWY